MILRAAVMALLLVTVAVLETALFPALALLAVRTDVLLLAVIAVALHDGQVAGLRVGFAAGLLSDLLLTQAPIGLSVLVFATIGYAVGVVRPYLAPDSWTAPILIAFLSGLIGTGAYGVLARLLGDDAITLTLMAQAALTVAATSALLAPVMMAVVRHLTERFPLRGPFIGDRLV